MGDLREQLATRAATWRRFADEAERLKREMVDAPAHWAGADMRARVLRECADVLDKLASAATAPEDTPATEAASSLAAARTPVSAAVSASDLATALLAPGNEPIKVFAANGGAGETRWQVVWAKGIEADRLGAWLEDEDDLVEDDG